MIKAVFIDIDDTLLDFDAYVRTSIRDGFSVYGLGEYTEETYQTFRRENTKIWHELEKGTITFEQLLNTRFTRVFAALGIEFDGPTFETYFRGRLFDSAIPVEGAMEALTYLKKRYPLYAASNGPCEQQKNRLRVGGMFDFFEDCFISEQIGHSKPSKEYFDYCLQKLNEGREIPILPSEIIMIGDSLTSDMDGAIGSGLVSCFFDKKKSGQTGGRKVDYVITSLSEIPSIL